MAQAIPPEQRLSVIPYPVPILSMAESTDTSPLESVAVTILTVLSEL